ncbi:hypothetical protein [Hoeflea sp.]|uniref:hypothetical protein n=1 Tax=Hoeflea sp. TaxID=1940281 RepID=UPI003A954DA5
MSNLARIQNGVVAEIISNADGDIAARYHPDFVAALVECGSDAEAGWLFADGEFSAPPAPPTEPLADIKFRLKSLVDQAAESERLKYITAGAGQAMTYQQKTAEARAFLDDVSPVPGDYPLLSAEVGITAATIADVANTVLAAFEQWQVIGAAIEAARLGTKMAINAADTAAAAQAAFDAVAWPGP